MRGHGELNIQGFIISIVIAIAFALLVRHYLPLEALHPNPPSAASKQSAERDEILRELRTLEMQGREIRNKPGSCPCSKSSKP